MSDLVYDVFETSLGWVGVLASPRGVRSSTLPKRSPEAAFEDLDPQARTARHAPTSSHIAPVRERIIRFFKGNPVTFTEVQLDLDGVSPFFRRAWEACRTIPPGETRTYQWLAAEAGNPKASRAAGQSMARNRLAPIIPCHRVVGSDGSLHGYGGGLALKDHLLTMERKLAAAYTATAR